MKEAIKERPILMNAEMVRAVLEGRKTQTRRVVKFVGGYIKEPRGHRRWHRDDPDAVQACPFGQPGDRLYVRETWATPIDTLPETVIYRADYPRSVPDDCENLPNEDQITWKPCIHMPRSACRIILEIVSVRAERVQEIDYRGLETEGVQIADGPSCDAHDDAKHSFKILWDSVSRSEHKWEANPLVWVVEFKKVEATP